MDLSDASLVDEVLDIVGADTGASDNFDSSVGLFDKFGECGCAFGSGFGLSRSEDSVEAQVDELFKGNVRIGSEIKASVAGESCPLCPFSDGF